MIILDDTDPMPFGKHRGIPMQDVPPSYLFWLWSNGKELDKQCPVADYIRRNLDVLETEYPDGEWRPRRGTIRRFEGGGGIMY